MSDISRKALDAQKLVDWLNVEINLSSGNDPVMVEDRWAFSSVKKAIERGSFDIPSTESEGEATQGAYNNLLDPRIVENKRLRAENERLRATLELIKRNEMFEHMTKTSTWRLADEPLSSHREDAEES